MDMYRSVGENGENEHGDVFAVQEILNGWRLENDLAPIVEDGVFGPETSGAIIAFQQAQGAVANGLIELVVDVGIPLSQGQGEGATIADACKQAQEACQASAGCAPGTLRMGKCMCWKGGLQEWTCIVQCSCTTPSV